LPPSGRAGRPAGWLLLALGLSLIAAGVARGYAGHGLLARPGSLPAADLVAAYDQHAGIPTAACLGFVLLLTPPGRRRRRAGGGPRTAAAAGVVLLVASIEAFSTRLRQQVDLDTLTADLLAVVDRTVQPARSSLCSAHPCHLLRPWPPPPVNGLEGAAPRRASRLGGEHRTSMLA
jgi:hypothetical protein